jgi:hypothetical protein
MVLTMTLPDGTRAGIKPTRDLEAYTIEELGLQCLDPTQVAPVVFYVPNRPALDRVRERLGLPEC